MHDIRMIRENASQFDKSLKRRGLAPLSKDVLALDKERREKINLAEEARAQQNMLARQIAVAKAKNNEAEFLKIKNLVSEKKQAVQQLTNEAKIMDEKLYTFLMSIPNTVLDEIPDGKSETDNLEIKKWGVPNTFDFKPKEHFEVTGVIKDMDFECAAKLSGSRFVVLHGALAKLHRALAQFMLDTHTNNNGLEETWTPVIVNEEMMYGTGNLPKFGSDSYQTTNGQWLIPT